jgi:two-component system chemotaxis response regulator CheB
LEVAAVAPDPTKALRYLKEQTIDVITLDVEMPNMDGLEFLRYLMKFHPKPVLMISSWTHTNSELAVKALALGAIDCVGKPVIGFREGMEKLKTEIITKIRVAAQAHVSKNSLVSLPSRQASEHAFPVSAGTGLEITTDKVIVIGTSTGGTVALTEIFKELHPQVPGIIVIQHMSAMFTPSFASSLQQASHLRVHEAKDGEQILAGQALVVPGGKSLTIKKSGAKYHTIIAPPLKDSIYNPSINHTFNSVALVAGRNAMGIILTGMGDDGAEGLRAMRENGAYTIAQDEKTSVIYGMPQKAWEKGGAVKQIPLERISSEIHLWAGLK